MGFNFNRAGEHKPVGSVVQKTRKDFSRQRWGRSGIAFASDHKKKRQGFMFMFMLCLVALQTSKHICQQAEPHETQQLLAFFSSSSQSF
jgi:hypothetical protein